MLFPGGSLFTDAPETTALVAPSSTRVAAPAVRAGSPRVRAVAAEPPPDWRSQAAALADRGRLDEAEQACRHALAADRLHVEAWELLGAIQQERGQLDAAADTQRRVLFLRPESADGHLALGNLLLRTGEEAPRAAPLAHGGAAAASGDLVIARLREGDERGLAALNERARALALPEPARTVAGRRDALLVFTRGGESYGVALADVREAVAGVVPTALPGSRPALAGVALHRGQVIALVDLAGLRGAAVPGGATGAVLVVGTADTTFGLLADHIGAFSTAGQEGGDAGGPERWIRGTTHDLVAVLDLGELSGIPGPRGRMKSLSRRGAHRRNA